MQVYRSNLKNGIGLFHKIRKAMSSRDSLYKIGGNIEMDEAFFGRNREDKRGRGSENKVVVVGAIQVDDKLI